MKKISLGVRTSTGPQPSRHGITVRGDERYTDVFAEVVAVTDGALLLDTGGDKPLWIPKALVQDGDDYKLGDSGDMKIAEWKALEKGMI